MLPARRQRHADRDRSKIIKGQSGNKSDQQQSKPANAEWKPKQKQEIQVRNNVTMQMRNSVQHIHLHGNKDDESQYVLYQIAQVYLFC